jgi:eukaryotic-like serine/threonine-protein kinase
MHLWTEFEGVTIDSAFALTKLVQTEGRSAFFSTRNENGESVLIRIIECHFDEDEILARWRALQTLSHPNFLRIDRFGQFYMAADDVTAVYVVFERVEANLGEVLERGRLSAAEAAQIGLSVSSALETLHAAGFVHEHIEPRNIYAVGDKVKLRSDCTRETPEGEAGMEARWRDVHELAAVLMQVLLGTTRSTSVPREGLLPAPFDEIVRNGMNGSWGLKEIKAALGRVELPKPAPQKTKRSDPVQPKPAAPSAATSNGAASKPAVSVIQADSISASTSTIDFSSRKSLPEQPAKTTFAKADARPERSASFDFDSTIPADFSRQKRSTEVPVIFGISEQDFRKWMTTAVLVLGVVLIGWILLHYWLGRGSGGGTQAVSTQPTEGSSHTASTPRTGNPSLGAPVPKAGTPSGVQWRVVAFTYKRQDQAQKKASSLQHDHPGLSAAVFSPNGRAPWLVTIGGAMDRDAAYALARKARSLGLPRDTYAQNYKAR